jgi:hypothetical protein
MNRNDQNLPDPPRSGDDLRARGGEQFSGREEVAPPPPPFTPREHAGPPIDRPSASSRNQADDTSRTTLFPPDESSSLKARWSDIQAAFVDEPREAVKRADALVNDVTRRVSEVFTEEREALEKQWDRGDQVTTEDLRVTLQRYRAFFDHLLSF